MRSSAWSSTTVIHRRVRSAHQIAAAKVTSQVPSPSRRLTRMCGGWAPSTANGNFVSIDRALSSSILKNSSEDDNGSSIRSAS